MAESSIEDRISYLEDIHRNFQIVGGSNITVEGSLRQGYAICSTCPQQEEPAVPQPAPPSPPPPATGACCIGTDCSITTEADCIASGGTYQGDGTVCDPNPCVQPCTFDDLPTHVTGTLDFSGVFCCDDMTQCTITAHYDIDDDLLDHLGTSRRFLGLGVGTATYNCGEPSSCTDPSQLEVEIYVQCVGDNFTIHLFTQTSGVFCCATAGFTYNNGEDTIYTPPVIGVLFPLDVAAGNCCGSCDGSMVLTLT